MKSTRAVVEVEPPEPPVESAESETRRQMLTVAEGIRAIEAELERLQAEVQRCRQTVARGEGATAEIDRLRRVKSEAVAMGFVDQNVVDIASFDAQIVEAEAETQQALAESSVAIVALEVIGQRSSELRAQVKSEQDRLLRLAYQELGAQYQAAIADYNEAVALLAGPTAHLYGVETIMYEIRDKLRGNTAGRGGIAHNLIVHLHDKGLRVLRNGNTILPAWLDWRAIGKEATPIRNDLIELGVRLH